MSDKIEDYIVTEYLIFCNACADECRDTERQAVIKSAKAKGYVVDEDATFCGECMDE